MSHEHDKIKNSKRRFNDGTAVKRQLEIAKTHGAFSNDHAMVKQPHRMAKHHAMDCGKTECFLCGNPRKTSKDRLTAQEKRMNQDMETYRCKHSNGLLQVEEHTNEHED